jgi:hypothetical protein
MEAVDSNLLLSSLFNLFFFYGSVAEALHKRTIISLLKFKTGGLAFSRYLRAIALSNSITKILESLLYKLIESKNVAVEYQFGF